MMEEHELAHSSRTARPTTIAAMKMSDTDGGVDSTTSRRRGSKGGGKSAATSSSDGKNRRKATTNNSNKKKTSKKGNNSNSNNAIGYHDVLCGRGGLTNQHVGNKNFRYIVAEYTDEYLYAKKKEKKDIALRIVQRVRDNGGRFLKRCANSDIWAEVTHNKALEKSKQALREGLDVRHKTVRPEKQIHRRDSESSTEEDNPRKRARLVQGVVMESPVMTATTIRIKVPKTKRGEAKRTSAGANAADTVTSIGYEHNGDEEDDYVEEEQVEERDGCHDINVTEGNMPEVPDLVQDVVGFDFRHRSHTRSYGHGEARQQQQQQQQYRTPRVTPSLASLSSQFRSSSYYPESYRSMMDPSSSSFASHSHSGHEQDYDHDHQDDGAHNVNI